MIREVLRDLIDKLSEDELREIYNLIKLARENAGLAYEYLARLSRRRLGRHTPMRGSMPPLVKRYVNAEVVSLPPPRFARRLSVEDAIISRRSRRSFRDEPLTLEEISTLLYLTAGISRWIYGAYGLARFPLRTYPSAGALQPVELYLSAHSVAGLRPGLYHYNPVDHVLEKLREGDFSRRLIDIALGQEHVGEAPATVIMTVYWARTRWKYGDRAYRYAMLDAGFAGENLYLACEALGLGTCAVGAFYDDELCELLEIDCVDEIPVLMFPVGRPSNAEET